MKRIQRSRAKGWRLPAGAIYVGRPSRFGNPWRAQRTWADPDPVVSFRLWLTTHPFMLGSWGATRRQVILDALPTLRGHDLACWCPEGSPCHGDILIELSNR